MSRTAPPVTAPAPNHAGRPPSRTSATSRVSSTIWLALIAGVCAIIANVVLLGGHEGAPVLTAARDVGQGEAVSEGDFRVIDVSVPDGTLTLLLRPGDLPAVAGRVATHALAAGQPVGRTDLADAAAPDRQRAMSIPIDAQNAVAGRLHKGDLVDVIDSSTGVGVYVVVGAPVLDVGLEQPSRGISSSSQYALTVAVNEQAALRLAAAIAAGDVAVVRSTGAVPAVVGAVRP